jgi:hypothetical protein
MQKIRLIFYIHALGCGTASNTNPDPDPGQPNEYGCRCNQIQIHNTGLTQFICFCGMAKKCGILLLNAFIKV